MKMTGSQIIMEILLEQGVDTVFGYPGGAALNIYDDLRTCHFHVAVPLFLLSFVVSSLFLFCIFFDTHHYITLFTNVNNFF